MYFRETKVLPRECSPTDGGRKHGVIEQMIKPIKIFPIVVYTSWLYDFSGRYTSWLVPTCVRREGGGGRCLRKRRNYPSVMRGRAEGKSWIVGCTSCARHAPVILAWFTWSAVAYLTPFSKVISIDYLEIDALVPRALLYLASTPLSPPRLVRRFKFQFGSSFVSHSPSSRRRKFEERSRSDGERSVLPSKGIVYLRFSLGEVRWNIYIYIYISRHFRGGFPPQQCPAARQLSGCNSCTMVRIRMTGWD